MAEMKKPGEAHIFPTQVFHRSGTAPRRCIKLVFFYKFLEVVDIETKGSDEGECSTEPKVKSEKKSDDA